MNREPRPIVIRRPVVSGGHGHHGGAWKVAYADFVTAMMAFFLLLWLISSASEDTLKGLAEFFSNATVNIGPPGGVGGVLDGITVVPSSVPPLPSSPFDQQPSLPNGTVEPVEEVGIPTSEALTVEPATDSGDASAWQERAAFARAKAAILAALQVSPELRLLCRKPVRGDALMSTCWASWTISFCGSRVRRWLLRVGVSPIV